MAATARSSRFQPTSREAASRGNGQAEGPPLLRPLLRRGRPQAVQVQAVAPEAQLPQRRGVEPGQHLVAPGAVVGHDVEVRGQAQGEHLLVLAQPGQGALQRRAHHRALEPGDGGQPPAPAEQAGGQGGMRLVGVEQVDWLLLEHALGAPSGQQREEEGKAQLPVQVQQRAGQGQSGLLEAGQVEALEGDAGDLRGGRWLVVPQAARGREVVGPNGGGHDGNAMAPLAVGPQGAVERGGAA